MFVRHRSQYGKGFVDEVKTGVILVKPNASLLHKTALALSEYDERTRGGQPFFTRSFRACANTLDITYHGNIAIYSWKRYAWPAHLPTILHFTLFKPSPGVQCGKYEKFCAVWRLHSKSSSTLGATVFKPKSVRRERNSYAHRHVSASPIHASSSNRAKMPS